jgi:hypothetical protein
MPGEITFDHCCRIILEDWRGRRDSVAPELRDYRRLLLMLLCKEFGIWWDDDWQESPRDAGLPALVSTLMRNYAGLGSPFAGWIKYTPLPGEQEVWHRHQPRLDAAEKAIKQRWVALFRDLLLLRWPEAAHRRTSWEKLRKLGLREPPVVDDDFF